MPIPIPLTDKAIRIGRSDSALKREIEKLKADERKAHETIEGMAKKIEELEVLVRHLKTTIQESRDREAIIAAMKRFSNRD